MLDTGKPIRIFYANLLYLGVSLRVRRGQLQVIDPQGVLSPVYQDEIIRRREQLIALLSVPVPDDLALYCHRLITAPEVETVQEIANQLSIPVRAMPVNGGWLIEVTV